MDCWKIIEAFGDERETIWYAIFDLKVYCWGETSINGVYTEKMIPVGSSNSSKQALEEYLENHGDTKGIYLFDYRLRDYKNNIGHHFALVPNVNIPIYGRHNPSYNKWDHKAKVTCYPSGDFEVTGAGYQKQSKDTYCKKLNVTERPEPSPSFPRSSNISESIMKPGARKVIASSKGLGPMEISIISAIGGLVVMLVVAWMIVRGRNKKKNLGNSSSSENNLELASCPPAYAQTYPSAPSKIL